MKVYLAGPINGCTDGESINWRDEMKHRMPGPSWSWLDPMRRDYRGREDGSVSEIIRGDLDDIRACDVVLANCWEPSFGTAMEIYHAKTVEGKPVIVWTERGKPVSPWLRHFSDYIVNEALTAESVLLALNLKCSRCFGSGHVCCDPSGVSIMRMICPVCAKGAGEPV